MLRFRRYIRQQTALPKILGRMFTELLIKCTSELRQTDPRDLSLKVAFGDGSFNIASKGHTASAHVRIRDALIGQESVTVETSAGSMYPDLLPLQCEEIGEHRSSALCSTVTASSSPCGHVTRSRTVPRRLSGHGGSSNARPAASFGTRTGTAAGISSGSAFSRTRPVTDLRVTDLLPMNGALRCGPPDIEPGSSKGTAALHLAGIILYLVSVPSFFGPGCMLAKSGSFHIFSPQDSLHLP
ncbi:hypothetical protein M427DRAFT_428258 [Gonapodya prolifera JEL478]|uniref:Uncharacterized protein n=1 Tax=Gonapodya prolifera (strain JEL478) TaxID=1344416 RepID=A0A139AT96_GONPJ|nr:hypothetical protein M427DRAFT_428258 [Gonapodya prolifera JEL478]|eukprot:KXS19725.1 hypothetical protein M427DRAFT_428258 [Gonapodya prolifera JEL478]